ncbi:hypothetical protein EXVG_00230 [Emiliania huxleyi virus 202]|nr:hypothetical protein EXVG_00230 [Emiliania huxleyi virus 202]AHA54152.1 putative membrane protein [Emiliania huxleyi virus 18]AHA55198.1 putative membrane protein [Emiliania huxleyi virus 156]
MDITREEAADVLRSLLFQPPRAVAVDADQNARIHQMVAQGFNPDLVYAEAPPLNRRRSSAYVIDPDLLTRMQMGPSCYLFTVVLMIYTSDLRYILDKRFQYLQSLVYDHQQLLTDEEKMHYESLKWVANTSENPWVCDTTLPRPIIDEYISAITRYNEHAILGDKWRPYTALLYEMGSGGQADLSLISVLNACGLIVPEDNFVEMVLKDMPNVVSANHVYRVRKYNWYFPMTMPDLVNETTRNVASYNAMLPSPFIVSFNPSDKSNEAKDQGMLVEKSTARELFITVLESVMMYVELFKQKYHNSKITCTHFALVVNRVTDGPGGDLVHSRAAHAVLLYVDNDNKMLVFDGNKGNSQLFEVWYASFTEKYIEILSISVALIPVTGHTAVRMI